MTVLILIVVFTMFQLFKSAAFFRLVGWTLIRSLYFLQSFSDKTGCSGFDPELHLVVSL